MATVTRTASSSSRAQPVRDVVGGAPQGRGRGTLLHQHRTPDEPDRGVVVLGLADLRRWREQGNKYATSSHQAARLRVLCQSFKGPWVAACAPSSALVFLRGNFEPGQMQRLGTDSTQASPHQQQSKQSCLQPRIMQCKSAKLSELNVSGSVPLSGRSVPGGWCHWVPYKSVAWPQLLFPPL